MTSKLVVLTAAAILLCDSGSALGQAYFFDTPKNALGLTASAATNDEANGVHLEGVFTINSTIDVELGVGRVTAKNSEIDLQNTPVSVGASIYLARQSAQIPVAVSISGFYQYNNFSSEVLDAGHAEMSGSSYGSSISIHKRIPTSTRVDVIPSGTFGYSFIKLRLVDDSGFELELDDEGASFSLGAQLSLKDQRGGALHLGPRLIFNESTTTIAVSLGYVFGLNE